MKNEMRYRDEFPKTRKLFECDCKYSSLQDNYVIKIYMQKTLHYDEDLCFEKLMKIFPFHENLIIEYLSKNRMFIDSTGYKMRIYSIKKPHPQQLIEIEQFLLNLFEENKLLKKLVGKDIKPEPFCI